MSGAADPSGGDIAVIGLGLIGGSLLRRLAAIGRRAVGCDSDRATREAAGASGLRVATDLAAAVRPAAIVVLAVSLDALTDVVGEVAPLLPDHAVLTDVGSVKQPVYAAARAAGLADRFVGGHPMAGTERSGFGASDPRLFDGAAWALCLEPDTTLADWLRLAALVTELGARVVPVTAADHDGAVARISQLPHLLAAALAVEAAAGGSLALSLAAGSFRDATRVAGTDPALTTAMCRTNRAAVDAVLAETIQRLRSARADPTRLLVDGHRVRGGWPTTTAAGQLRADAPDLRERLLALGRSGGWVQGVAGGRLTYAAGKPP